MQQVSQEMLAVCAGSRDAIERQSVAKLSEAFQNEESYPGLFQSKIQSMVSSLPGIVKGRSDMYRYLNKFRDGREKRLHFTETVENRNKCAEQTDAKLQCCEDVDRDVDATMRASGGATSALNSLATYLRTIDDIARRELLGVTVPGTL